MRVLVTGALGFSGRHLLKRLSGEKDLRIAGLDRADVCPADLHIDEYWSGDVARCGVLDRVVKDFRPDRVFHLAGRLAGSSGEIWRTNVLGTWRLLRAVAAHQSGARVVLIGSAAEYGTVPPGHQPVREDEVCRPVNLYGRCKHRTTTQALRLASVWKLGINVARPFNLVGGGVPQSLVVGAVLQRAVAAIAQDQRRVEVGNLDSIRDFVDVADAVEAYWRISAIPESGEVYNICSGVPRTVASVLEHCLLYAPNRLTLVPAASLQRSDEVSALYGDPGKTERATGFRPRSDLSRALMEAWQTASNGFPCA